MLKALKNITKVFLILISIIVLGGLVNALSGHEESPEMKKLHAENSERIKARMQSMNLNVLGGTTSEDRLELMNEQDSLSFSDTYIIGHRYLSVSAALNQWIDRAGFQPDPSFNLRQSFQALSKDVPPTYWGAFNAVQSEQEADLLRLHLFQELKDAEILGLK